MSLSTGLDADAAAWDRLVDTAPVPTPYLRSWWLGAWPPGDVRYLLVEDDRGLVGGLPLRHRAGLTDRLADVGVTLGATNLDLLAAPGREADVAASVRSWLTDRRGCSVRLRAVAPATTIAEALPDPTVSPFGTTLVDALDGDPEAYLAARPHGLAKRVRRARTALEADGFRYELATHDAVGPAYDAFLALHAAAFGSRSTLLPHADIARRALVAGAEAGEVVAHLLVRDGEVGAVELCLEVGGRLTMWHGGRDPALSGASNVLMAAAVARACARGDHELDIGLAGSAYKYDWAGVERPSWEVQAHTSRLAAAEALASATRSRIVGGLQARWAERRHRGGS